MRFSFHFFYWVMFKSQAIQQQASKNTKSRGVTLSCKLYSRLFRVSNGQLIC